MNPEAPTPLDPVPEVPKSPPQAEANTNEIIGDQTANANGSNPVEMLNHTAPFSRYPKNNYVSIEDDNHSREHERMPIWLKLLLAFLAFIVLIPIALPLFLFVICKDTLGNNGHW